MENELFDAAGRRLYLTCEERRAVLAAAEVAERHTRTFCLTLAYTGCRISEALTLTAGRLDLEGRALVFETLKKRRRGVYRAVPVPPAELPRARRQRGAQAPQWGSWRAAVALGALDRPASAYVNSDCGARAEALDRIQVEAHGHGRSGSGL